MADDATQDVVKNKQAGQASATPGAASLSRAQRVKLNVGSTGATAPGITEKIGEDGSLQQIIIEDGLITKDELLKLNKEHIRLLRITTLFGIVAVTGLLIWLMIAVFYVEEKPPAFGASAGVTLFAGAGFLLFKAKHATVKKKLEEGKKKPLAVG